MEARVSVSGGRSEFSMRGSHPGPRATRMVMAAADLEIALLLWCWIWWRRPRLGGQVVSWVPMHAAAGLQRVVPWGWGRRQQWVLAVRMRGKRVKLWRVPKGADSYGRCSSAAPQQRGSVAQVLQVPIAPPSKMAVSRCVRNALGTRWSMTAPPGIVTGGSSDCPRRASARQRTWVAARRWRVEGVWVSTSCRGWIWLLVFSRLQDERCIRMRSWTRPGLRASCLPRESVLPSRSRCVCVCVSACLCVCVCVCVCV